jgi:hypothetical protein
MSLYYPRAKLTEILLDRIKIRVFAEIKYIYDLYRYHKYFNKTSNLFKSKCNKEALILANGPSVLNLDPTKINKRDWDVFCVNAYADSDLFKLVVPTHYVLSDPGYLDSTDSIQKLIKHDINIFMPFGKCPVGMESAAKVYYFCDRENECSNNITNILRPRLYLSMTAYKALAISLYMGYEKIYICGFDNNYFLNLSSDVENRIFIQNKHFYNSSGYALDASYIATGVGEYLYKEHRLFSDLENFPKDRITNLDPSSLTTAFNKKHNLDIYKAEHNV